MPDSFFATSKPRKRKRSESTSKNASNKIARKAPPKPNGALKTPHKPSRDGKANGVRKGKGKVVDEELESDASGAEEGAGIDDMDLRVSDGDAGSGEEDEETPAEKRLRLAKLYIESVKDSLVDGEFDAAEIDKELIAARLKQDVLEHSGKLHLYIADTFDYKLAQSTSLRTRGHRLPVTSAVASEDAKYLFTAGKEGSIIKWNLRTGRQQKTFYKIRPETTTANRKGKGKEREVDIDGHSDEVLALAVSGDGKYLVSGGRDRRVGVWDVEREVWVKGFRGHKDTISCLSFRKGTQQLYSASFDRTLKLFDLSVMGYVETLFGHQDVVLGLDSLRSETAVSVGGRDKTVRFWKVVEESQLVFRGGGRSQLREVLDGGAFTLEDMDMDGSKNVQKNSESKSFIEGSIDCVAMIDESTFISGGDSGSICLWTTQKKKPSFTQPLAHGLHDTLSSTEGVISNPRWITAIACLRYSDLVASGSWDGFIRLWKLDMKAKSFIAVATIPAPGVINSLQLVSAPKFADFTWESPGQTTATGAAVLPEDSETAISKKKPTALLVAGVGQEHRLGRWLKLKGSGEFNGALVVPLHPLDRTTNL